MEAEPACSVATETRGGSPVSTDLGLFALLETPEPRERAGSLATFQGWKFAVKHSDLTRRALEGVVDLILGDGSFLCQLSIREMGRVLAFWVSTVNATVRDMTRSGDVVGPGFIAFTRGRQDIDSIDEEAWPHFRKEFGRTNESDEDLVTRLYVAMALTTAKDAGARERLQWQTLLRDVFPELTSVTDEDQCGALSLLFCPRWGRHQCEAMVLWFDLLTLFILSKVVGSESCSKKIKVAMDHAKGRVMEAVVVH